MTKIVLCLLIGAGLYLVVLEYIEAGERRKAALMEKWRGEDRDV